MRIALFAPWFMLAAVCLAGKTGAVEEPPARQLTNEMTWTDEQMGFAAKATVFGLTCPSPRSGGEAGGGQAHLLRAPGFGRPESILLLVETTNTSQKRKAWANPPSGWRVHVRDESGVDVPMTHLGRRLRGIELPVYPMFSSGQTQIAEPGETVASVIELSDLFDMSLPGLYAVVFQRGTRNEDTGETRILESPPLQVGVGSVFSPVATVCVMQSDENWARRRDYAPKVGEFAEYYACKLHEAARKDENEQVRRAARGELERLRVGIDTMLSELDKAAQEGAPKPAPTVREGEGPPPAPTAPPPPPAPPKQ